MEVLFRIMFNDRAIVQKTSVHLQNEIRQPLEIKHMKFSNKMRLSGENGIQNCVYSIISNAFF